MLCVRAAIYVSLLARGGVRVLQAPSRAPSSVPTAVPTGAPSQAPSQVRVGTGSFCLEVALTVVKVCVSSSCHVFVVSFVFQAPSQAPSEAPTQHPSQVRFICGFCCAGLERRAMRTVGFGQDSETTCAYVVWHVLFAVLWQIPTLSPSISPTQAPSLSPTSDPTQAPTDGPSSAPSKAPSQSPTQAPSKVRVCFALYLSWSCECVVTRRAFLRFARFHHQAPSDAPTQEPSGAPTQVRGVMLDVASSSGCRDLLLWLCHDLLKYSPRFVSLPMADSITVAERVTYGGAFPRTDCGTHACPNRSAVVCPFTSAITGSNASAVGGEGSCVVVCSVAPLPFRHALFAFECADISCVFRIARFCKRQAPSNAPTQGPSQAPSQVRDTWIVLCCVEYLDSVVHLYLPTFGCLSMVLW